MTRVIKYVAFMMNWYVQYPLNDWNTHIAFFPTFLFLITNKGSTPPPIGQPTCRVFAVNQSLESI